MFYIYHVSLFSVHKETLRIEIRWGKRGFARFEHFHNVSRIVKKTRVKLNFNEQKMNKKLMNKKC